MYTLIDSPVGQFIRTNPELLTATAEIDPDVIALAAGNRVVSYGELDAWSDRISATLTEMGASEAANVVMALPPSIESVAAVWSVAKTGAALASIDAADDRITAALAVDWRVQIGITNAELRDRLPQCVTWFVIDEAPSAYVADVARAA